MMSSWLSEDSLLHVKEEMTLMGAIGLEPVSAIFQPKSAINAKTQKIAMNIKDVVGQEKGQQILLTLHDKRKNEQWTISIQLDDLEKTLAMIFIRIKEFQSLHICSTDLDERILDYRLLYRSSGFASFLSQISAGLLGAVLSFPSQSISFCRLFLPPHSEALTIPLDDAFKLISFLAPSLIQLRFGHNRSSSSDNSEWERLFSLLAEKCSGLQKLKVGGHCCDWPQLQAGLSAVTNLRSFEYLAFDSQFIHFHRPIDWLRDSFQHNHNLKHLSITYNALLSLVQPSAASVLNRLEMLKIKFDVSSVDTKVPSNASKEICDWIVKKDLGQSILPRLLAAMPDKGRLALRLNCLMIALPSSIVESLVKDVFKAADATKKRISARFNRSVDMMQIAERLKNDCPLLEVNESRQHCTVIRRGMAACVLSD